MGIAISLIAIAAGAVLAFAVDGTLFANVDINVVGVILIAIGGFGLVLSLALMATGRADRLANQHQRQERLDQEAQRLQIEQMRAEAQRRQQPPQR